MRPARAHTRLRPMSILPTRLRRLRYSVGILFSYFALPQSNAETGNQKRTFSAKIVSPLGTAGIRMPKERKVLSVDSPADVTQILLDWNNGDNAAPEKLMPLVYDELRRLAR